MYNKEAIEKYTNTVLASNKLKEVYIAFLANSLGSCLNTIPYEGEGVVLDIESVVSDKSSETVYVTLLKVSEGNVICAIDIGNLCDDEEYVNTMITKGVFKKNRDYVNIAYGLCLTYRGFARTILDHTSTELGTMVNTWCMNSFIPSLIESLSKELDKLE